MSTEKKSIPAQNAALLAMAGVALRMGMDMPAIEKPAEHKYILLPPPEKKARDKSGRKRKPNRKGRRQ